MSVTPKFVNNTEDVVAQSLQLLSQIRSDVHVLKHTNTIIYHSSDIEKNHSFYRNVSLLCGGGSGHEPAHGGFVGRGWLAAAVCGNVFASPPTSHVAAGLCHLADQQWLALSAGSEVEATKDYSKCPGIVVVIKNYAGDIINFTAAVEEVRDKLRKGIKIQMVLAADDVAFGVENVDKRRGLAGCVLLYKILGAAAAQGASMEAILQLAQRVTSLPCPFTRELDHANNNSSNGSNSPYNLRTLGASLSSCSLPGSPPSSLLPASTVEVGLGIHGEKGLVQQPYTNIKALVAQMMKLLLQPAEHEGVAFPNHSELVLFVNNLGGTTDIEMNIIASEALSFMEAYNNGNTKCTIRALHIGRHMTSLEMHGFSLTLLRVEQESDLHSFILGTAQVQPNLWMEFMEIRGKDEREAADGLTEEGAGRQRAVDKAKSLYDPALFVQPPNANSDNGVVQTTVRGAIETIFKFFSDAQVLAYYNRLDAEVGDGDIGTGLYQAAQLVLALLPHLPLEGLRTTEGSVQYVYDGCFDLMAQTTQDGCGGTSGPFFAAMLRAVGVVLQANLSAEGVHTAELVRQCVAKANSEVQHIGGARKGDRTFVDVLTAMENCSSTATDKYLGDLLRVAEEEAAAVRQLPAKFGRSRYYQGKEIGKPDPGCEVVVGALSAVALGLESAVQRIVLASSQA